MTLILRIKINEDLKREEQENQILAAANSSEHYEFNSADEAFQFFQENKDNF